MEILIKTTFIIIILFAIVNLLISLLGYAERNERIHQVTAYFWSTLILSFIVLAVAQKNNTEIILSFSFSLIPVNLMCMALFEILQKRYKIKPALIIFVVSTLTSYILIRLQTPFWLSALPLSVAAAIPMAITIFHLIRTNRNRRIFALIAIVLFAFIIHGFNFAFFRHDPDNQLWGWPVTYAIYQALAMLIPTAVLAEFHHREAYRMQLIIDQKTQSLKDSLYFKNFLFKTLAHDISTPLSTCQISLQLAKSENIPPHNKFKHILRAERSIENMLQITRELKLLEDQDLDLEYHNLEKLMVITQEEIKPLLESKKLKLVYDSAMASAIDIKVHAASFTHSMFANLLRNSIKFSPEGKEITLTIKKISKSLIEMTLINEGPEIHPGVLPRIFDLDYKLPKLGSFNESGTGWSLPICKVLMTSYGGKIEVSCRPQDEAWKVFLTSVKLTLQSKKASK